MNEDYLRARLLGVQRQHAQTQHRLAEEHAARKVAEARCAELEAECAHLAAYVAEARRQLAIARVLLERHGATPGTSLN